jgi:hypothetical protein
MARDRGVWKECLSESRQPGEKLFCKWVIHLAQSRCGRWLTSVIPVQTGIQNCPRESGDLMLPRHPVEKTGASLVPGLRREISGFLLLPESPRLGIRGFVIPAEAGIQENLSGPRPSPG